MAAAGLHRFPRPEAKFLFLRQLIGYLSHQVFLMTLLVSALRGFEDFLPESSGFLKISSVVASFCPASHQFL